MRLPNIQNYQNSNIIETLKIKDIPEVDRRCTIMSDKDKIKRIKEIEKIVRSSMEYRQYISFLRDKMDMDRCRYFKKVSNENNRKISIEIHHEPFSLFDITQTVLNKYIYNDLDINVLKISEEIMKIHYQNMVGLIPLSVTVHELVHRGDIFIPLQETYGNFKEFIKTYERFIDPELFDMLRVKLKMSKELVELDMSILEKKYRYIEVDGMTFPEVNKDTIYK